MIKLRVNQSEMHFIRKEVIASGAVKAYKVCFVFDDTWEGLKRIALFKADDVSIERPLDENDMCEIPWEVIRKPGVDLMIAAVGVDGDVKVLPTIWVNAGMIQVGVGNTVPSSPSPSLYQQLLSMIGDLKNLSTDAKDNLVAAINEVYLKDEHNIAVDQDVDTMLDDVFGNTPLVTGEVATDQDILSMLDGIFRDTNE